MQPGKTYTFSFWAMAEKPAKIETYLRTTKPPYKHYGKQNVDLSEKWQQYQSEITLPEDYSTKENKLFFCFPKPGVYWLDDICIKKK